MKVAKNMDSVFDSCTQDELNFDAFFDNDDCLIDMVAGLDESGNLLTGEYIDLAPFIEEAEKEESQGVPLTIGGEVGDGKEVTGKEKSAESHADDVDDEEDAIGYNDKRQTALEGVTIPCPECGALPCKCGKSGKNPFTTYASKYNNLVHESDDPVDALVDKIMESVFDSVTEDTDPIEDKCDCGMRDGDISRPTNNVEGRDADPVGASYHGIDHTDVIEDLDDEDMRDGSAHRDNNNQEGVSSKVIEAVMSKLNEKLDDIDVEIDAADPDDEIVDINITDEIVPDSVRKADVANIIKRDNGIMESIASLFAEAAISDEEKLKDDDEDDELITLADDADDDVEVGDIDLDYDYDDDELIDMVISNGDKDIDLEDL